jgi:hypothetical protein
MKSILPLGRAEPTKSARNDEFTRVARVLEIAPNPSWLSKVDKFQPHVGSKLKPLQCKVSMPGQGRANKVRQK